MKRALKIIGWGVGVVVLLLAAATLAIKLYCTKERVLGWVVPPLEAKLHRTITVADVGAGLTGLHLDGIDVRAAGADAPLLSTRRVQASWNPWSLLGGTVEITEVRLVEPKIRIVRLPDGSLDVDDLRAQGAEEDAKVVEPGSAEPAGGGGGPPVAVVVRVFALEDGRAEYQDRSVEPAASYVLEGIDARVTEIAAAGPIPFELSARMPLSTAARFTSRGTVDASAGAVKTTLQVADFELAALNQVLGGELQIAAGVLGMELTVELADPGPIAVAGEIKVPGFTLAANDVRGASADIDLQLDATADLGAETASLKALGLGIGDQLLTGTVGVSGWGKRPQLSFQLRSDELRVDELLALLPPGDDPDGESIPGRGERQAAGDNAPPAGVPLDAEGDLAIALLRHGSLKVENLAVHFLLKNDQLQLDPATAELYGGTLAATAAADLASQGPAFEATTRGEDLNLGRLLAALKPQLDGSLTGTAALELTARGLGGDLAALESHTKLNVKDGKLVTHPLVQEFTELFKIKEYRTLNFYDLLAEVGTQAGVASVDSLIFRGPKLQATGKGTVTLQKPEMDLRLAVALPREVASRLVGRKEILDTLTDAQGWTRLPLRLEGSPDAPRYGVDDKALEMVAAKALEKKAGELLEKAPIGEKEKELLEKGMKSLFGK